MRIFRQQNFCCPRLGIRQILSVLRGLLHFYAVRAPVTICSHLGEFLSDVSMEILVKRRLKQVLLQNGHCCYRGCHIGNLCAKDSHTIAGLHAHLTFPVCVKSMLQSPVGYGRIMSRIQGCARCTTSEGGNPLRQAW